MSQHKPMISALIVYRARLSTGLNRSAYLNRAATVYAESTAYASNNSPVLAREIAAIAFLHLNRNDRAYGVYSVRATRFRNTKLEKRTGKMASAHWEVISALIPGGFDYSYGADMWDEAEQSLLPEIEVNGCVSNPRNSAQTWELHMNTMGSSISGEHYAK